MMQARELEVDVGSAYAVTCPCSREVKAEGPLHIQPMTVKCECGAVYHVMDGGEVTVLVESPPKLPKTTPVPKPIPPTVEKAEVEAKPIKSGAKKSKKR